MPIITDQDVEYNIPTNEAGKKAEEYTPSTGEVFKAYYNKYNAAASYIQDRRIRDLDEKDPNYNVYDDIEQRGYGDYIFKFNSDMTQREVNSVVQQIDFEEQNNKVIENSGAWGYAASLASMFDPTDPINLAIGFGAMVKMSKGLKLGLAAEGAFVGGGGR